MELLIMLDQLTHPDARAFFSAPDPAAVLVDLHRTGQLPEVLTRLAGIPQPADSHPEGDVWTHTLLVVEQAAMLAREHRLSESQRFLLLLACLVHDLGKMDTTVVGPDGRIRSWKH
ncbi:MAG TPA: HD domain-containing protein, partial [Candidatus Ozemobacteraceae bacterium]|nr:HD domain-containing protein [Candidatus Ozemobacteraceae bacterium]